jgi:MFS family permease
MRGVPGTALPEGEGHLMTALPVGRTAGPPDDKVRPDLVAALMLAMGAGTIVQFAIPALGPVIVRDLGFARAELGGIMAAYYVAASVLSPIAGRFADRTSQRAGLLACFVLGTVGLVVVSGSSGAVPMMLAVVVGGAGAALVNPATNRVILVDVPIRARGLVTGLKQSGVQLATIGSGLLLPSLALMLGWRTAMLVMALIVASIAPITLRVRPARRTTLGPASPMPTATTAAGPATTSTPDHAGGARASGLNALCVFGGLMGAGMASVSTYLPIFVVDTGGWDIRTAGLLMATLASAAVAARLAWGHIADRGVRPTRILTLLGVLATVAASLLLLDPLRAPWAVWVAVLLLGISGSGWHGLAMMSAMTIAGPGRAGWATGRVIAAFYAGLALSPVPVGLLADLTGSFTASWLSVCACFATAGVTIGRWGEPQRLRTSDADRSGGQGT